MLMVMTEASEDVPPLAWGLHPTLRGRCAPERCCGPCPRLWLFSGRKWDVAQGCVPGPGNAPPRRGPPPSPARASAASGSGAPLPMASFTAAERAGAPLLSHGAPLPEAGSPWQSCRAALSLLELPPTLGLPPAPLLLPGLTRAHPGQRPILRQLPGQPRRGR